MKCLFVYNPVSGKGKIKNNLDLIVSELKTKYEIVDVYETKQAKDMITFAKNACGNYEILVFSGGDGSFNEIINGIAEEENKPILGYIPTGTVNDVARTNKIKRNIKKALNVILTGTPAPFDIIKVNDKYAIYVVGYGAMTDCSYCADQIKKHKQGKFAYVNYILKHSLHFNSFSVQYTVDGEEKETDAVMVMIMNTKSLSSFPVNRCADLQDGKVDVLIVTPFTIHHNKKLNFFTRLINLFKISGFFLFGYNRAKHKKNMITFQCEKINVKVSTQDSWNFDGERGDTGEIQVSVVNKAIQLIVPNKNK